MMNKFNKTSYPGRSAFTAVSASQARRHGHYPQPQPTFTRLDQQLQKKIQIQSSLLINSKKQPKKAINIHQTDRNAFNKSQTKFYETSIGFTHARERPQSKQEARSKPENKAKTQFMASQRPQTSKGVRNMRQGAQQVRQRQKSQQDDEVSFPVKVTGKKGRTVQSSYSRRDNTGLTMLSFETSIDPQFLGLFAN